MRKGNSSSYVYFLRKTSHLEVSRRSRTVDVKEMHLNCDARVELLFCS